MHLIHVQLGTLGRKGQTQKVHKLDGFPHGVVILLLCYIHTHTTNRWLIHKHTHTLAHTHTHMHTHTVSLVYSVTLKLTVIHHFLQAKICFQAIKYGSQKKFPCKLLDATFSFLEVCIIVIMTGNELRGPSLNLG